MTNPAENDDWEIVECPACAWPCRTASDSPSLRRATCPECGQAFSITSAGIVEQESGAAGIADGGGAKKIELPTGHTGNMRERRGVSDDDEKGEAKESRDPNAHRLNPEKRTKLVPITDLAAEPSEGEEWRVGGLDKGGDDDSGAKSWSGKQFGMIGVGLIAIVSLGVFAFGLQTAVETAEKKIDGPSEAEQMKVLTNELVELIEGFLQCETTEARLPFVRNPETVQEKMADYYSRPGNDSRLRVSGEPLATNLFSRGGAEFAGVVIDFSDLTRRATLFEESGDGWLLDWESFVGYSEMGWDEFLQSDVGRPVKFRLLASPDDYYNFDYSDDEKFDCYRLTDVGSTVTSWGYCEKNSEAGKQLARAVRVATRKGLPAAEVVLSVKFDGKPTDKKQLLIESFQQDSHLSM